MFIMSILHGGPGLYSLEFYLSYKSDMLYNFFPSTNKSNE